MPRARPLLAVSHSLEAGYVTQVWDMHMHNCLYGWYVDLSHGKQMGCALSWDARIWLQDINLNVF